MTVIRKDRIVLKMTSKDDRSECRLELHGVPFNDGVISIGCGRCAGAGKIVVNGSTGNGNGTVSGVCMAAD